MRPVKEPSGAKEAAKKVAVANSTIPGLRRGILSVVPDGTGFWAEIQFPGLRPAHSLSSLTGLVSGLRSSSQDLRPGLFSFVPAGLFLG
jgi:hypothetical protein